MLFIATTMFAFSANANDSNQTKLNAVETSSNFTVLNVEKAFSNTAESMQEKKCKLTIEHDGDTYTITVHGVTCAELLKQLMKK